MNREEELENMLRMLLAMCDRLKADARAHAVAWDDREHSQIWEPTIFYLQRNMELARDLLTPNVTGVENMEHTENDNKAAGAPSELNVGLGMTRPVRCYFCGDHLYYRGDSRYVPEVRVEAHGVDNRDEFYAHATCWNRCLECDA